MLNKILTTNHNKLTLGLTRYIIYGILTLIDISLLTEPRDVTMCDIYVIKFHIDV